MAGAWWPAAWCRAFLRATDASIVGFFRKLLRPVRNDHARQLARDPDMHRVLQPRRLVERAAFDADRRAALARMPQPRAAGRTERAVENPPGIPGAGPVGRRALRQPQRLVRDDHRDAERRGRLLAAF